MRTVPEILKKIPKICLEDLPPRERIPNPSTANLNQDTVFALKQNELKLWLLRPNGDLLTGDKSDSVNLPATSLLSISLDAGATQKGPFLYSHTSLAQFEGKDFCSALCAGWLVQRGNFLLVIQYSEKFNRHDFTEEEVIILSKYISSILAKAYQNQPIIFVLPNQEMFLNHVHGKFNPIYDLEFYRSTCLSYNVQGQLGLNVELAIDQRWLLKLRASANRRDIPTLFRWHKAQEEEINPTEIPLHFRIREFIIGEKSQFYYFKDVALHTEIESRKIRKPIHTLKPAACDTKTMIRASIDAAKLGQTNFILLTITELAKLNCLDKQALEEIFSCMENVDWLDLKGNALGAANSTFQASTLAQLHEDVEIIDLRDNQWNERNIPILVEALKNLPDSVQYVVLDEVICELLKGTGLRYNIRTTGNQAPLWIYANSLSEKNNVSAHQMPSLSAGLFAVPENREKVFNLSDKNLASKKDSEIISLIKCTSGSDVLLLRNNYLGTKAPSSIKKIMQAIPASISKIDITDNDWNSAFGANALVALFESAPFSLKEIIIPPKEVFFQRSDKQMRALKKAMKDFEESRNQSSPLELK